MSNNKKDFIYNKTQSKNIYKKDNGKKKLSFYIVLVLMLFWSACSVLSIFVTINSCENTAYADESSYYFDNINDYPINLMDFSFHTWYPLNGLTLTLDQSDWSLHLKGTCTQKTRFLLCDLPLINNAMRFINKPVEQNLKTYLNFSFYYPNEVDLDYSDNTDSVYFTYATHQLGESNSAEYKIPYDSYSTIITYDTYSYLVLNIEPNNTFDLVIQIMASNTANSLIYQPPIRVLYDYLTNAGYQNGYDTGSTEGYQNGYNTGYGDGFVDGSLNPADSLGIFKYATFTFSYGNSNSYYSLPQNVLQPYYNGFYTTFALDNLDIEDSGILKIDFGSTGFDISSYTVFQVNRYLNDRIVSNLEFGTQIKFYFIDGSTFLFESVNNNDLVQTINIRDYKTTNLVLSYILITVPRSDMYFSGLSCDTSYSDAYLNGLKDGLTEGEYKGYQSGLKQGESIGFNKGYNQGTSDAGNYTFLSLLGAVVDAPIQAISGLLNFNILGMDMSNFFFGLMTIGLIIFVIRLFI